MAQAGSSRSPVAPDPLEKILSSQGSPIITPPKLVPAPPGDPYENSPAATVTRIKLDAGLEEFHLFLKEVIHLKR